MKQDLEQFTKEKIRSQWDEKEEKWYISIVDIIRVLTESPNPRKYWSVLKTRLKNEGSELTTNCSQLKMQSADGKFYLTDVADDQQVLRLIQSIPSPKAEPIKLWLAKIGNERIEETENPEMSIDRAMQTYLRKGYSKEWINQRLKSIEVRKDLTDEWDNRGVKAGKEFAILTDIITHAWSEKTVKEYKQFKNLKKENLRDHITNLELVLNMLAEATTTEISKQRQPDSFEDNKVVANEGGSIAGNTRRQIEAKTGRRIVSSSNSKQELNAHVEVDNSIKP